MSGSKPGFGWRPITPGELLPPEYYHFNGLAWVHKRCSSLAGMHWEAVPNLSDVHVRMTEDEIAAHQFKSLDEWDALSVDERFLYNRAAYLASSSGQPVQAWLGDNWERWTEAVTLTFPFRPKPRVTTREWYLLEYAGGSVIGFRDLESAQFAMIGQDVRLIVTREVIDE